MNELIATHESDSGEILVSGRDLHNFLNIGTQYTKWFERMISYGFEENQDFVTLSQKRLTAQGNVTNYFDHHLKLDMAKEISMLQRTEKGKQARQYFLKLEKLWNSPEAVMKRALEYADKKMKELHKQIEQDKPYTNFGKAISNSDAAINIGAFAKLLYDEHGLRIGRNRLFAWLREKGYLIKHGRERNNPKQRYVEQGLFETRVALVSRTYGDVESVTTLITGKGQVKIAEELLRELGVTAS